MTTWNFVLPSTCLYKGVSYSTYELLFAMQIVQGVVVFIAECACDSFFFSITVHLCGQLELLRLKFTEIDKNSDNKHRGNLLGPLVERHCQLIVLARNIEDAFNINILLRLLIINIVIATGGNINVFRKFCCYGLLIKILQYHNQNESKINYFLNVQKNRTSLIIR